MDSLLNDKYLQKNITSNDGEQLPYLWTHGATPTHLGDGIVVYSLVQNYRAKTCVCLGSGGGYIPRLITQARYDLYNQGIFEGKKDPNWGDMGVTYLVDAANGVGGRPDYLEEDSFFRTKFEPRLIVDTTENAYYNFFVKENIQIDFLFIDADHSYEGVKLDFELYSRLVKKTGIIVLHDTDQSYHDNYIVTDEVKNFDPFDGPAKFIKELDSNWRIFNLFNEGILKNKPSTTGLTLVQHA